MRTPHPMHLSVIVAVAAGGAVGAVARYCLSTAFPDQPAEFPWTIFAVNVGGCFLLALLPAFAVVRRRPLLPPMLGTGALGGFTTMSTYAEQSRSLLASGQVGTATAYVVGTLVTCLAAVVVADRFSALPQRAEFDAADGVL